MLSYTTTEVDTVSRDPENHFSNMSQGVFVGASISHRRWNVAGIIGLCFFLLLIGKTAYLQIIEGESYRSLAEGNRVRTHVLVPPRGVIYDHKGVLLVENVPDFEVIMTLADIPADLTLREEVLMKATSLIGVHRADIDLLLTTYARTPFDPVSVRSHIPYETAMRLAIDLASLSGFELHISSMRSYPSSFSSLSHVLGYMGKISEDEFVSLTHQGYQIIDEVGKTGVEQSAESLLRGVPGEYSVEVDARGHELLILSKQDPVAGASLTISIDSALQAFIEQTLQQTLSEIGASRASAIVMDSTSGAVRALVSLPAYNSNLFASGITTEQYEVLAQDLDQPLFPRAVSGEFPSGSTFKPFVAYAALAEGLVNEHTSFLSTGGLSISEWFFPDWKAGGHGVTDVRKAIAESVNTYFYIIGGGYDTFTGLGVEKITDYAARFGFGFPTGIDLSGEADGFLPSKAWKEEEKGERWYVGDTYHLAIGQGDLLVTPLQMASAVCTIANGGNRVIPHLVESAVFGGGGEETFFFSSEPIEDLDMTALRVVKEGMRQAVTSGSARLLSSLVYPVAGKTGTAQTPGDRPTHAWFIGFGPYSDAEIAVVVMIEEGGEGSLVATPIARDIFSWWFAHR
ncbi:MAG: Penicillin-binding protein 2 [Candidatus Uhrbacteria bacterium GW2011_GWE2_46_68]|uniref:Penicillin-binding protein 2 n=2 Tax=Candidatus Uhriibacteriota TaxID=1752732 RepID=A0A0G1Q8J6_9BACT|nr:MAG: Penicillin-binding protein 2 [Candidatus Uhrbacteria bacterium GW2011_GWF2_46_218]KKU41122.1 MAG: Penicillin-binding protein 2 [Candidatus Uhrbacteria bacterium GW2011_GWE2_46_68]